MSIEKFKKSIIGVGLEFHQVEKILIQAVRARHLSVRFDHQNKCLRFDSDTMETTRMRSQLVLLSRNLTLVARRLQGSDTKDSAGKSNFTKVIFGARQVENKNTILRKGEIEAMKQLQEKRQLEEAKHEEDRRKREEIERRENEKLRLEAERNRREKELLERLKLREDMKMKRAAAKEAGINISDQKLQNMTGEELLKIRQETAIKEHRKQASKMREQSRRVDYLCRALRDEERPKLLSRVAEMKDAERNYFVEKDTQRRNEHRATWEKDNASRQKLAASDAHREAYVEYLYGRRQERLDADLEKATLFAQLKKRRAKLERAKKRALQIKLQEETLRKEQQEREAAEKAEQEARQSEEEGGRWQKRSYGNEDRSSEGQGGSSQSRFGSRSNDNFGDRPREGGDRSDRYGRGDAPRSRFGGDRGSRYGSGRDSGRVGGRYGDRGGDQGGRFGGGRGSNYRGGGRFGGDRDSGSGGSRFGDRGDRFGGGHDSGYGGGDRGSRFGGDLNSGSGAARFGRR